MLIKINLNHLYLNIEITAVIYFFKCNREQPIETV